MMTCFITSLPFNLQPPSELPALIIREAVRREEARTIGDLCMKNLTNTWSSAEISRGASNFLLETIFDVDQGWGCLSSWHNRKLNECSSDTDPGSFNFRCGSDAECHARLLWGWERRKSPHTLVCDRKISFFAAISFQLIMAGCTAVTAQVGLRRQYESQPWGLDAPYPPVATEFACFPCDRDCGHKLSLSHTFRVSAASLLDDPATLNQPDSWCLEQAQSKATNDWRPGWILQEMNCWRSKEGKRVRDGMLNILTYSSPPIWLRPSLRI